MLTLSLGETPPKKKEILPLDLSGLVFEKETWTLDAEGLREKVRSTGFSWLSKRKEAARAPSRTKLTLGMIPLGETIIRLKNGHVNQIELFCYNRGDDDHISREDFFAKIEEVKDFVSSKTKVRPEEEGRQYNSVVGASRISWPTPQTVYLLEFSQNRSKETRGNNFQGEFIRLRVAHAGEPNKASDRFTKRNQQPKNRTELAKSVRKEKDGDVWISGIPMVDQGEKGYCAVASAERVLRYYGLEVDQHEMAQISNASASVGTNPEFMGEALKKAALTLNVSIQELYTLFEKRSFKRLVDDYNRTAKRKGRRSLTMNVNPFANADREILQETRLASRDYQKFRQDLRTNIDEGIPLLWALFLGVYPEPNIPQLAGGHMRLIIGYNDRTNEIIFSDSWGARHAKKRMPIVEAFTMTTSLQKLAPRR